MDSNGFYKSKDENGDYQKLKSIETRNVFTVFNYKDNKLVKEKEFEIKYDRIFDDYYKGIEDMRLMEHNNELFFTGSKITNSQDLTIYIEHGKINLDDECVESCLLDIENRSKTEKNWVMFSNNSKKYIVYNWFPITVCKFEDKQFDLAISLGCFHNLKIFELNIALKEMERVAKNGYLMLESYRSEQELFNLQCWALTCESFFEKEEWIWIYNNFGYSGDYEFIYFE